MLQTDKTGLRGPLKKGILTLAGTAVLIICVSVVCAFTLVKHVTVDNGYGQTVEAVTMKNTVGELLDEQQINLNQGDVVTPSLETKLERKQSIAIQRAVAVTLQADNNQTVIYTVNQTVGELLEEAGITLGEADICNYSMEDSIEADMLVEVNRISEELVTVEEEIPCNRVTTKSYSLPKGQDKVIQEGENWIAQAHYMVTMRDGEEIGREAVGYDVIKEPVDHIVEIGALEVVMTSRGDVRARASYVMNATGYDVSYESTGKNPGEPGFGVTATGVRAAYGVVAVDPSVIPLGSRLYIQSADGSYEYGYAIAADTGGAIKGNKIDLCFSSRSEALAFGRRNVVVYVLE